MCGRFGLDLPPKSAMQAFGLEEVEEYSPRLNIAPGTPICAIVPIPGGKRAARLVHWGLVPSWAKDPKIGFRMINARAETLAEKPAFRNAFKRRRCLIPATVFYEWKKLQDRKQPFAFVMADRAPFTMAGIWEHWLGADGSELLSASIVTTEANELLRSVHDRMPVILPPEQRETWLLAESTTLAPLLAPYPADSMLAWPVSTSLNSPRNLDVSLEPVD